MADLINVEKLTQTAKEYNPILKTLPSLTLAPKLEKLGINLLEVGDGENIETTEERRGGILKPMGVTTDSTLDGSKEELIRYVEMGLLPKQAYAALKDNIMNYTSEVKILNSVKKVNQQTKEHPFAARILMAKVLTVGEDQIDALFHAKRDVDDQSPLGITDGYYTLMDSFVAAAEISEAKKNLISIGSLATPATEADYAAWTSIVAWVRSLHPAMRNSQFGIYIPGAIMLNIMDALANKFKYISDVTIDMVQTKLREHAIAPGLVIITDPCLGTGTRIFACALGSLDYGMTGLGDAQFVQVRNPYTDPNWIQYWMQFKVGQRIKSLHPKMFAMTDGTTVSLSLSGDYIS